MKPQTRIELIDRDTVVSLPMRLPVIFMPHLALIALAWTADGLYAFANWAVSV
jgi:hypothetical protein